MNPLGFCILFAALSHKKTRDSFYHESFLMKFMPDGTSEIIKL